eukprot:m.237303 g.237303  ORF g.237303 m.237303 type:complete len:65 (+) comp16056_c0_seq3:237-431(+)
MASPINEVNGTNKDGKEVPLIDPSWTTDVLFMSYVPAGAEQLSAAAQEEREAMLGMIKMISHGY